MPTYLDLFAGAGGLSEGFVRAGFTPVAHVEMDSAACNTLRTRAAFHWLESQGRLDIYDGYLHGRLTRGQFYSAVPQIVLDRVIERAISDETLGEIFTRIRQLNGNQAIDYIVGGPPCQAYSIAGRSRDANKMVGDPRNYLYEFYAEFLREFQPRYFVFENVLGLLTARDKDGELYLEKMRARFREAGYLSEHHILNAKDYGVPQSRRRIIMVGCRGESEFFPTLTKHVLKSSINELFEDLPKLHAGEGTAGPVKTKCYSKRLLYDLKIKERDGEETTFHIARPNTVKDLTIYSLVVQRWNSVRERMSYTDLPKDLQTQSNIRSFMDRFKVVAGDLPYSQTVVAHICKDGHYYIHPDIKQNRSLTPREAARLQTFPDNFYFEGVKDGHPSRTAAFKQIGNAVPVVLGEAIAKAMREQTVSFDGLPHASRLDVDFSVRSPSSKRMKNKRVIEVARQG